MFHVIQAILLPPGFFIVLVAGALVVRRFRPRLGRVLLVVSCVVTYALSTRVVAAPFLRTLQPESPWTAEQGTGGAGAIVVLGGDLSIFAYEYNGPTVGRLTLERVRYAARVHEQTGLPLLVTGGDLALARRSLADMMAQVLDEELGTPVRWQEPEAGNTHGNAWRSAEILTAQGIDTVMLVTHAWHMPRARASFEAAGLGVVPAPTGFDLGPRWQFPEFLPSAAAVRDSAWAMHEWIGRAWYRVRYRRAAR